MKGTLGMVLIISSPFIGAGVLLALLKAIDKYNRWRYRRNVAARDARLLRLNITPFRGTKKLLEPLL